MAWIDSVPDRSVLVFKRRGCYRIDGTLEITDRRRLDFNGNGATFTATTVGARGRSHWRLPGGAHLIVRDMRVHGANAAGGTFNAELQHQHAFDLAGARDVELRRVTASGVYGDCVYVGRSPRLRWSGNILVRDSRCHGAGRMGVAVVAGRGIVVRRTRFSRIARTVLDIEPNRFGLRRAGCEVRRQRAIGPLPGGFFSAIGQGPVDDVTIARNTLTGAGMYMAVMAPHGERRSNIRIVGNRSDSPYRAPGSAALDFERVDGLTVTRNAIPVSGPGVALASVAESCDVRRSPGTSSHAARAKRVSRRSAARAAA